MNVEYCNHYSFLAQKHMHFYIIPLSVSLIKVKISFSVCQFKVFTAYNDVWERGAYPSGYPSVGKA